MDAARRLVLTTAEVAALAAAAGVVLPSGFPADPNAAAEASLAARGLVVGDPPRPVPALATTLGVLGRPTVGVRVEVAGQGLGLRAVYAVAGPLGAGLLTLPGEQVELSVFPAEAVGRELIRAVPEPDAFGGGRTRVSAVLGREDAVSLAGRLPLAALEHFDHLDRFGGPDATRALGLTQAQARLAQRLTDSGTATLRALVTGHADDDAYVGQVVWIATGQGWVGIRPIPDETGQRMVELVPVARHDIGVWLAPAIAELVEVHSGQP